MQPTNDLTPQLSRTPGTSLHRQLFTVLRNQILDGVYPAGAQIPQEEKLVQQFSVSRVTVRRALADLERQGLVEKRQGIGTFASHSLPPVRLQANIGFIESLQQVSDETQVQVLVLEHAAAGPEISRQLELEHGAQVMHVLRLRSKATVPVMLTEAWVPERFSTGIEQQDFEETPLYKLLGARGIEFDRVIQETTAIAASPQQAKLLAAEVGQPLVKLTRLYYDAAKTPVLYLHILLTPERSRFLMDLSIDSMNTLTGISIIHDGRG